MIHAQIIKHSTSYLGKDIITWVLNYPRYIHAELMTHRVFSKNSASSRAIPIEKFIQLVRDHPVTPLWTENQKGMQGPVITDPTKLIAINNNWLTARDGMIIVANALNNKGVHKQNVNRLLEPWMHIKIVLTGTDFHNWYELRNHPDAQGEIRELAKQMWDAQKKSVPDILQPGDWHIPFGDVFNQAHAETVFPGMSLDEVRLKVSVARAARVSYNNFSGVQNYTSDIALFDKLLTSKPLHASPAEHQARVPYPNELPYLGVNWNWFSAYGEPNKWTELKGKYFSNLQGWIQLRKLIECGEFK